MTSRKFFSGLPDRMMTKYAGGPDRQQTNFYWPNETDSEQVTPQSSRNRLRNRSMSNASLMSQSQASTDTEESRRRKLQNNQSKIEFYDMVDVGTDSESVYSRSNDPTKHKKQETLRSRISFYDFVDTDSHANSPPRDEDVQSVIERPVEKNSQPSAVEHVIKVTSEKSDELDQSFQNMTINPVPRNGFRENLPETPRKKPSQYDSYSESEDEERFYRSQKYLPPRYPPSQRSIRPQPRRYNSEFFDFDDDGYDRQYDSPNRRLKYRKPENLVPRMVRRRDYSPELSDEDYYEGYRRGSRVPPSERYENESYYRGRGNRRGNGYGSEMDHQRNEIRRPSSSSPQNSHQQESNVPTNGHSNDASPQPEPTSRPPVKPLTRTMSINEAKQRYHVNLKSNIFHNDPDYNVLVEQKRPPSVREFAARQRVGVGLPDI